MKILLLYPKWTSGYGIFAHFAKKASVWPPLNLAYLATIAKFREHEVKIIDGQAEDMSLEKMASETIKFGPDIIGITATTPFFHIAIKLATEIKWLTATPILIGGPHISILKEKAFFDCFDYAFIGEAEKSFGMFLDRYKNGEDISTIKGILLRDSNGTFFTGDSEPIDIDMLPIPARYLLKTDLYKMGTLRGTKKFTTIMATRGCPFKCIFCSTKVFGNKVRKRNPQFVVNEIMAVISAFGIKHFIFLDDTMTLDKNYMMQLCNMIINENLDITFEGSTRADFIDDEIVSKMVEAGLIRISFGLETVDPEMRKTIRKEVPLESYIKANRIINKYGIEIINSCIIGLPGETIDTIKKTLTYLRKNKDIKQANMAIAMPYPGTELYDMAKNERNGLKLIENDFSKYRRYGSAVMSVGNLSPKDLVMLQNDAFVSIYSVPWRLFPMIRKSGILAIYLMLIRLVKSLARVFFDKKKPSLFR